MSVRDDEFRDPNPGRQPYDPPKIRRSDAEAFMRHGPGDRHAGARHTVPANIARAVQASTAAGLPAEAMVIENMALMLVVEFDGAIRLRTALPDPDAVAEALEHVAKLVRSGTIGGQVIVDDEEADRG